MTHETFEPAYRDLLASGALDARAEAALAHLEKCDLCPWECGVNRAAGRLGSCKTSRRARVSSHCPHMGEEDPLRGTFGSGTIFFSNCNMRCQYCQNYTISQLGEGRTYDADDIAGMMLDLQRMGCHNVNLVSPSHVVAQIIEAVAIAAKKGLRIPIVYNTGGYDSLTALALLDGIVDIYMPDIKYADEATARRYSKIRDYPRHNRAAVREMHRQVGDLVLDGRGIAQRGLLVRHLVLPGGLAGTEAVARFLADEISPDTYINLMGQYQPQYKTRDEDFGPLSRPVTATEMADAYEAARRAGLYRFDKRRRAAWRAF
jgi:putative pyruvate formate lyase activating enzyme